MLSLLFMQIGVAAGNIGLMEAISAAIDQKEAKEINKKANEIIRGAVEANEMQHVVFELEPIMPALKGRASLAALAAVVAVLGTCGMAEILAAIGNYVTAVHLGDTTSKYTVLSILGDGSLAVEAAILGIIAVGMVWAVLCAGVKEKAAANLEKAYANLFAAKRIKRERIYKQPNITYAIQSPSHHTA